MTHPVFQTTATHESDDVIKFQSTTPKGNLFRTFTFTDEYLIVVTYDKNLIREKSELVNLLVELLGRL